MRSLSWYILIILVLISIPSATIAIVDEVNPLFGFVSFVANDMPQDQDNIEGCRCNGSKVIRSGDGLFSKPCGCPNCQCKKVEPVKPKKPDGMSNKDSDCDILKSMGPAYRKFLPKQKGKELWVLSAKWCAPCQLMKKEFEKMAKTGWRMDLVGDLEAKGDFHIRVIDFDNFEELPKYFYEIKKDKDGNIIMKGDNQEVNALLPTVVLFEEGKPVLIYKGFLNSFGLRKLWDGKELIKGVDDVPTT